MNPELDATDIGRKLGADGVDSVVGKVEQYCAYAQERIALKNHPTVLGLRIELSRLRDEERELEDRLSHAPPSGDLRHNRRKAIYAWTTTILLTVAGFFLALLTFEPFRLGWKSYLYCVGIAVVVPFLIDRLLDDHRLEKVRKALTVLAATAGIASLMALAVIRGHLLAQQIQGTPTVVIDGSEPAPDVPDTFYGSTLSLLQIATVLLSLATEIGAGLALRDAWRMLHQGSGEWEKLRQERGQVRQRMVATAAEINRLEDEAPLFVAQFWRDFYGAMLTHTVRNAMTKLLVLVVGIVLIPRARAAAQPHLDLVVALDLTQSVAVKGPDGMTEFQKNVEAVTHILAQVPSGSRISVVGITDRSFAQPYVVFSATIPEDPGYFGERLRAARMELLRVWKARSVRLEPSFQSTDVLGVLQLAGQILDQQPSHEARRRLVIFSDMRHHTRDLNLESTSPRSALGSIGKRLHTPAADLHQVQVYVLGVDGAGKSPVFWKELEGFWRGYFIESGAMLKSFSVLRELSTDMMHFSTTDTVPPSNSARTGSSASGRTPPSAAPSPSAPSRRPPRTISSCMASGVTGFPFVRENMRLSRIVRKARTSPSKTSSAAPPPSALGSSNSARTHSDKVSFRARARASNPANSSSLTLVPTDFVRSGGFIEHRPGD